MATTGYNYGVSNSATNNPHFSISTADESVIKQVMAGYDINTSNYPPSVTQQITQAKSESATATSERLYSIQSRAAYGIYNGNYITDRGPIASIRLNSTIGMTPGVNSSTGAITTAQSRAKNNTSGWNNSDSAVADLTTSLYEDSSYSGGFNRFILSSCDVNYSEKTQIMTTFGDSEVVYYFGKNPVIMNLQGILIDSLTDSWFVDFVNTYQTFLRGSQLAQNFQSITLVLPTMTVVGSVISLGTNENASRDTDIPFSMQFYAKSIVMTPTINPIGLIASNVSSKAIFNKATRTSMGASLPTLGSGFTEPSWVTSVNNFSSGITTPANTFATNVTSAITTTIASVTKFIGLITKTLSNLITAFTAPLNAVLRVITSVTGAVNAVASLVASSAASIGHLLSVPGADIATALSQLKNTAGVIHRLPQSVSQSFKANFHAGNYRSSGGNTLAILSSGKTKVSKVPALNSGYSYTPNSSVII